MYNHKLETAATVNSPQRCFLHVILDPWTTSRLIQKKTPKIRSTHHQITKKQPPQIYNSTLDPTWSEVTQQKNTEQKNLWVVGDHHICFFEKSSHYHPPKKKRGLKSSTHPKRRPNYQPIRSPSAVATKALISFQLPRPPTWLIHLPKSDPSSKTSRNS